MKLNHCPRPTVGCSTIRCLLLVDPLRHARFTITQDRAGRMPDHSGHTMLQPSHAASSDQDLAVDTAESLGIGIVNEFFQFDRGSGTHSLRPIPS